MLTKKILFQMIERAGQTMDMESLNFVMYFIVRMNRE